jgi:pimeloyl-ACP methyl ester carboxylesterase
MMSTAYESCSPNLKGQTELDLHSSEPFPNFDPRARFPESDVLELPVVQKGKELLLRSYRYPPKNYRKAVVFYIHGYGSYANQNGQLAKYLAEFDFEIFAIDQRGFGSCKGQKCLIEDYEDMYNDQWLLIFEAIKTYKIDQQKTPLFLLGRSFGAMLTTNLANSPIAAKMFTGVGLLQPYYRLYTERLYTHQPLVKLWKFFGPHRLMPSEFNDCDPEYAKKWKNSLNDPEFTYFWTPSVGVMWVEE